MSKSDTTDTLKKGQLIAEVAHRSGESKSTVRKVVDSIADVVRETVSAGEDVFLLGVGKLEVRERGEKTARNLHTGEKVIVPRRKVLLFRPSESVKSAANLATSQAE